LLQDYTKTHLRASVGKKFSGGFSPRTPIQKGKAGRGGEGNGVREGKGKGTMRIGYRGGQGRGEGEREGREGEMEGEGQKSITIFHFQMLAAKPLAHEMTP
jgi:hypothetical protein